MADQLQLLKQIDTLLITITCATQGENLIVHLVVVSNIVLKYLIRNLHPTSVKFNKETSFFTPLFNYLILNMSHCI